MIEQVLLKVTLKAGDKVWEEGKIVGPSPPVPDVLLEEVKLGTGNVEVLKESGSVKSNKLIFVSQRVDEKGATTMTSMGSPTPSKPLPPPKKSEPKPLLRRKK